jgi:hypothetical protein
MQMMSMISISSPTVPQNAFTILMVYSFFYLIGIGTVYISFSFSLPSSPHYVEKVENFFFFLCENQLIAYLWRYRKKPQNIKNEEK